MVERVASGIEGLDDLIEGGFPKGSVTLITGGAGTGKTIFSSQFLWHGLQNGENCLFITLEEEPQEVKGDAEEFDWNFSNYEDENRFRIEYINPFEGRGFGNRIESLIDEIDADRVVIDSTSVIGMYEEQEGKIRETLYEVVRMLRRSGVTSLITSEIPSDQEDALSRYGVEEFVSDGVIRLTGLHLGATSYRSIQVLKMRRTEIAESISQLDISSDGIHIKSSEEL